MGTTLEPRPIEPTFLRWHRLAWSLMQRSPTTWIVVVALGAGASYALRNVAIGRFTVAAICFYLCCAVAVRVDRGRRSVDVSLSTVFSLAVTMSAPWAVFMGGVAFAQGVLPSFAPRSALDTFWPFAVAVALYIPGSFMTWAISPWTFLIRLHSPSTWLAAADLATKGERANGSWFLAFAVTLMPIPVLATLIPVLALPVCCFYGALSYVVFRSVFLGLDENERPEASTIPATSRHPTEVETSGTLFRQRFVPASKPRAPRDL